MGSLVFIQFFTFERHHIKARTYLFAPIVYLMMYILILVELNALIKSLWSHYKHKDIPWQNWQRKGLKKAN